MYFSQVNVPTEFTLTAAQAYADIFNEVEVDVLFTGPDGAEYRVPAFWAGGQNFGVRFAAPKPGKYAYTSICSNVDDCGLHGKTGELEAAPYTGKAHLYQHGKLRVAASGRTLEHVDGEPFFWLGDTWWMGTTTRLDWPHGFHNLLQDRVAKGFNLAQIVAGPLPDFDASDAAWHPEQANEAGWPWEEGWTKINPGHYDLVDLKFAAMIEHGMVPCIVGMWGFYLPFMGVDRIKKHWRNLVARYGAYPVIWCICGEVNMPTYSSTPEEVAVRRPMQEEGWTEVTRYVREIDPFHNPMTAHPSHPDSRAMLGDESLLDVDMMQTGHSGFQSLRPTVETVIQCLAQQPPMPTINSEVNYEGIMGSSWQEVQRFCFWTSITSGSAGHTYGAQGIWCMNSCNEPFTGSTVCWGEGYWEDVMHLLGSKHVGLGKKFFDRYPWWLFEPRTEPLLQEGRISAFATGIPGAVAIYYIPFVAGVVNELQGICATWSGHPGAITIEPGANYTAYYFNPRTGADIPIGGPSNTGENKHFRPRGAKIIAGPVEPDQNGQWIPPTKPTMEDWVLVLEDKEKLAKIRNGR